MISTPCVPFRSWLLPLVLLVGALPVYARCTARIIAGPVKIRPYGQLPPASNSIQCAKNEICSFQVVITADREDCLGLDVSISEPQRASAKIPAKHLTIFREDFLHVFYRSSEQGDLGEWPDPLIPKIDPDYGEPRSAFPYDLLRISRVYQRHAAENGNAILSVLPEAQIRLLAEGRYSGGLPRRYIVKIVRSGGRNAAQFIWWSEPGPVQFSPPQLVSAAPFDLDHGVRVTFPEHTKELPAQNIYVEGTEFWFYAGPARHQPVWVDVEVPADSAAGTYTATVQVSFQNAPPIHLPVSIEVLSFALPSSSSLAGYFRAFMPDVYASHHGAPGTPEQVLELAHAYARAGLRNAITVDTSRGFAPAYEFRPDGSISRADYSFFDRAASPFLEGQGTPRHARWTSLRLPEFRNFTDVQFRSAVADFARHTRDRGWWDLLFDYTYDEPHGREHFDALAKRAGLLREVAPQIPRLVTLSLDPSLVGSVTRWCPVVNELELRNLAPRDWWRNRAKPRRADYNPRLAAGDSLWWYQACLSHGCGFTGPSPQFDNWPSYMVDISAVANRVFGLLSAVTYDVSGVLYWDVAYALTHGSGERGRVPDPWESLYYFGGNGDGTLFYPGRPAQIGGTHHIPIESLRLKFIRDSFFDAEYAYLLRKRGEEEFLQREVSRLVQNAYRWNSDPQAWVDLRRTLARRIAEKSLQR